MGIVLETAFNMIRERGRRGGLCEPLEKKKKKLNSWKSLFGCPDYDNDSFIELVLGGGGQGVSRASVLVGKAAPQARQRSKGRETGRGRKKDPS